MQLSLRERLAPVIHLYPGYLLLIAAGSRLCGSRVAGTGELPVAASVIAAFYEEKDIDANLLNTIASDRVRGGILHPVRYSLAVLLCRYAPRGMSGAALTADPFTLLMRYRPALRNPARLHVFRRIRQGGLRLRWTLLAVC